MSKIDPIILLLTAILIFLVVAAFAAEIFFKSDAVFFQFVQGLATTIVGALMMRVKPTREDHSADTVPVPRPPAPLEAGPDPNKADALNPALGADGFQPRPG